MVKVGNKNILGHRLVDGWTRWAACAYSGVAIKTAKQRGLALNGFRNFDDVKANGDRDWH